MPRLVSFMLCDSINNVSTAPNEITTMLISPEIALRPQFIPGNFSFAVSIGIADIDLKKENRVRFSVLDPSGKVVFCSPDNPFSLSSDDDNLLPKMHQGFIVNLDIRNLSVPTEGEYQFLLYVNDAPMEPQVIPIFKRG